MSELFPRSRAVIQEGIEQGLHPGAQLYVSMNGETLVDLAMGEARSGLAMQPDSLNLWMSSTKPVAAVAIAQLVERGLIGLDDRVVKYIPEFGANGKEPITIRHLLTHTGGFRKVPRTEGAGWDEVIAEVCAMRLEPGWVPGMKAGYHTASSWYMLGEIVRRVDGRGYSQYVRDDILEPIGMRDSWIGMPVEKFEAYGDRIAVMHKMTADGKAVPLDAKSSATNCRPGSSGWGPIRELGRFYEMFLKDNEQPVISRASASLLTFRHREGMFDETFKQVIDWGLGFLLNSKEPFEDLKYGYGVKVSPGTFGHGGAESSGGFCDPQRGLVVAYVFNGQPGEARHHERRKKLMAAVYDDAGIDQ